MTEQNTRLGIALMILVTMIFSAQDGISRHLGGEYNVIMIVMIRFWFFAVFAIALTSRTAGFRAALASARPGLQLIRGVLLSTQICVMVSSFVILGLVESLSVFTCYPLLVAALSGPVLGERVGWRRWTAICIGFVGVLVILKPGFGVFSPLALIPLVASMMFAVYALLTRHVGQTDSTATSFLWTGLVGAVTLTLVGIWFWEPMTRADWGWMAILCLTSALGHWLLIKCYEIAEASAVQPFAYLQLVFGATIGVTLFGEVLEWNVVLGAVIVTGAGIFTLWRERLATR